MQIIHPIFLSNWTEITPISHCYSNTGFNWNWNRPSLPNCVFCIGGFLGSQLDHTKAPDHKKALRELTTQKEGFLKKLESQKQKEKSSFLFVSNFNQVIYKHIIITFHLVQTENKHKININWNKKPTETSSI